MFFLNIFQMRVNSYSVPGRRLDGVSARPFYIFNFGTRIRIIYWQFLDGCSKKVFELIPQHFQATRPGMKPSLNSEKDCDSDSEASSRLRRLTPWNTFLIFSPPPQAGRTLPRDFPDLKFDFYDKIGSITSAHQRSLALTSCIQFHSRISSSPWVQLLLLLRCRILVVSDMRPGLFDVFE